MQTWTLAALLMLSLFANGYLIAQRNAAPAPDAGITVDLQRLMDDLDAEPEWRHRLVSLGTFAGVRDERRRGQQALLTEELYQLLGEAEPDYTAASMLLEDIVLEDAQFRTRVTEQLAVLLNDLDPARRMMLLDRLHLLDVQLDDFALFARLQP